jgi:D-alanyl-D-alanine carboxypeptidase
MQFALRLLFWIIPTVALSPPLWAQNDYELSYLLLRRASGQVLAAQEEDKLRTPASTMKVVTAAAALERLGPEHRYRTAAWSNGQVRKGRLAGDLALKGDADPELTQTNLAQLAGQVHALGIRRVDGDLVVDEGPYSDPPYGNGWAWDDAGEYYSPEVSGLAVDGGVVQTPLGFQAPWLIAVEPDAKDPALRLIPGREGVVARGALPDHIAPPRSSERTGELFRAQLQRLGIKVRGTVKLGRAQGREIAVHQSRPLGLILLQALEVSDNLAMELIYRSSSLALPKALEKERLCRADGSGLSRYNLISARQLTTVLLDQPNLAELFPSGGRGTLSKRFLEGAAAGQVRAKTGTLSNVSALTGYLFPGTPDECVFAIMVNGHVDSTAQRKAIENDLVESWAQQFGPPRP